MDEDKTDVVSDDPNKTPYFMWTDVIEKYIKRQGEEYKRNTILLDKLKK